jgi:hypothetical protein
MLTPHLQLILELIKNNWNFISTPCSLPSWSGQGQLTFSPLLLMVLGIMVVREIEMYDVCWIYLARERDQSWTLVYVWKCMKFFNYLRTY